MSKLLYFTPTSLDGCIADETGSPDWSAPSEDVFAFINDLLWPTGTYLYGRKTHETMAIWQTPEAIPGCTAAVREFARIWQAAGKIVYSRSWDRVHTEGSPLTLGDMCKCLPSVDGSLWAKTIQSRLQQGWRVAEVRSPQHRDGVSQVDESAGCAFTLHSVKVQSALPRGIQPCSAATATVAVQMQSHSECDRESAKR
jgi:hypothetical protein